MTQTQDTDTEHVLEQLQEIFERDDIRQVISDELPYDYAVERQQIYGKAEFYLNNNEAEQLRDLPVWIHSVIGRNLRLELVADDEKSAADQDQQNQDQNQEGDQ